MEQLDLLTIRKQPARREPAISSKIIRAYVKANLRGFVQRQRERERVRRLCQQNYQRQPSKQRPKREDNHHNMRTIKVSYRAVFEQPIGPLNPMGLKLPGPCPVEIFQRGASWLSREIQSPRRQAYEKLGKYANLEHAKTSVAGAFQKQVQDWQIWGTPPEPPTAQERLLTSDDITDLGNGQWGWIQDEDRTHILHGPLIRPELKIPNAACGAQVAAKCFISTKANIEPSCKACAEVWRREYKNK
jgi:hypothetical protein